MRHLKLTIYILASTVTFVFKSADICVGEIAMGVRDYHDASTDFKYPGSMEAGGNISGTFLAREKY